MFACLQIWNKKSRQETDGFKRKWCKHDYDFDLDFFSNSHVHWKKCYMCKILYD